MTARSDLRNASLCVLLCMAALLAAWPFSGVAFNDDWTWSFTVKQLHDTGHLVYNGWSSPSVILQAYWGLLWVKVFGFSFNVLRASSLPLVAGAIAMCYAMARRAGLAAGPAVFVTLMLGFSPLFMPMACTFMTDVPGLFFMLLAMYALVRGIETSSTASAIGWLGLGAVVALVGGSSRQVVWIVPLILLPYAAWLRRGDRAFAGFAIAAVVMVFAGAMGMQHWFGLQPYSLPDPPPLSFALGALHHPVHFAWGIIFLLLTTVLLLLPVFPGLFLRWTPMRAVLAVCIFAIIRLVLHRHWLEPWMGNVVTSTGALGSLELSGGRPTAVPMIARELLSVAVLATVSMLLAGGIEWIIRRKLGAFTTAWNYFLKPSGNRAGVQAILLTMAAEVALEMTRTVFNVAYDRHLLPLIPFLAIPMVMLFQRRGDAKIPVAAWVLLIIYGLFAVASTQEVNSLARARVVALDRLKAAGIVDEQVSAGFEHDYWVQLQDAGHVNDLRIRTPANAYDKRKGPTPSMMAEYVLESAPTPVTEPTRDFGSVEYFSLLPPFHRRIFIDRFSDPWWLDAQRAATRPVKKSLIPPPLLEQYRR